MTSKAIITIWVALFFFATANATSLSGGIENANGRELKLYYISNFLTGQKTVVDSCIVNNSGEYSFDFQNNKRHTYYINLGKNNAQVILDPDTENTIDLPAYVALGKAEYLNPYYEKSNILLYNEDNKDVNYYQTLIEIKTTILLKNILESQSPQYEAKIALDSIASMGASFNDGYLNEYLQYSSVIFHQMAKPSNLSTSKTQLRVADPDLQNTAFTKLFTAEYSNPFLAPDGLFYMAASEAIVTQKLSEDFTQKIADIHKIKNPRMAELLTIKGFYDAANYAPGYKKLITHLMAELETQLQDDEMKTLCNSTRQKMERLMVGGAAPYYELFTLKGKKVPLVLKRKNVLLAFVNTDIFECQKQLRLLEKFKAQYKRQLEVVCVAVYQDADELEQYLSRNEYDNIYFTLWQENEQLLDDYNVKALPSYYLIGSDGNLIYAPLSSPEEDMLIELQSITDN